VSMRSLSDMTDAEWHAMRAGNVGSSEISALFGLPDSELPNYALRLFALWHVKAGNAPPPEVDPVRTKWGLLLEAVIAEAAAEKHGWEISKGGYFTDPTVEGLACTLDYVIDADPDETGPGVLEAKNVDWLIHRRSWRDAEPPIHVLLQLQHQLAATGYTWGAVAALVGGNDLRVYRYKARPKLIADIRHRVRQFWGSIELGLEPSTDGSSSASSVLSSLYPEPVDDAIDMSFNNEWAESAQALFDAAATKRDVERQYHAARNRVAKLLGDHRRGYGNGWSVTCSIQPARPGREPEPGELIGQKAEVRRYSVKEDARA
jgi:predicted phage-related endonuclease